MESMTNVVEKLVINGESDRGYKTVQCTCAISGLCTSDDIRPIDEQLGTRPAGDHPRSSSVIDKRRPVVGIAILLAKIARDEHPLHFRDRG